MAIEANENEKDYIQILTKGLESSLNTTEIEDGKLRFTTDTRNLYLDLVESGVKKRIKISDIDDTLTEEEIFSILAPLPKIYISKDTHRAYVSAGLEWIDLAAVQLSLSEIKDLDVPLWFSEATSDKPYYSTELTYNTSTKELKVPNVKASKTVKVGGLIITDSVDENTNLHLVEFSFA